MVVKARRTFTPLQVYIIYALPSLGSHLFSHSCPGHLRDGLLGAAFEEYLEVATGVECNGTSSSESLQGDAYNTIAMRVALAASLLLSPIQGVDHHF